MTNNNDDNTPGLPANPDQWRAAINTLNTTQLQTLNEMICKRLDILYKEETRQQIANFSLGDQVAFRDNEGELQEGEVTKINRKTIAIVGLDGKGWKVSPHLLTKSESTEISTSAHRFNQPGKTRKTDWVAGIVPLPGTIEDGDSSYAPDGMIWMDGDGIIRDMYPFNPDDHSAADLFDSFAKAISTPISGQEQTPETIRTDNPELRELLSQAYPSIEFIIAEVPELTDFSEQMAEDFRAKEEYTLGSLGIPTDIVSSFFQATAQLYNYAPWRKILNESCLIGIRSSEATLNNRVITVIGQQGLDYGLLLFKSLADYEEFGNIALFESPARRQQMPEFTALNYQPTKETDPLQRKEIMEHGWQIAGVNAYPKLYLATNGTTPRTPDTHDLQIIKGVCEALTLLIKDKKQLQACWRTGKQIEASHLTTIGDTESDITVYMPVLPTGKTRDTLNTTDKLALLDRYNESDAWGSRESLNIQLAEAFQASAEYRALKTSMDSHVLLIELGLHEIGRSVATLLPIELHDVMYDIIPRKVMAGPSTAQIIFDDSLAFYRFLKREYNLATADACIEMLEDSGVDQLQLAMDNPDTLDNGNFITDDDDLLSDPQQEMLFDSFLDGLTDEERAQLIAAPAPVSSKEKKDRKKKRKNARKARKKNR